MPDQPHPAHADERAALVERLKRREADILGRYRAARREDQDILERIERARLEEVAWLLAALSQEGEPTQHECPRCHIRRSAVEGAGCEVCWEELYGERAPAEGEREIVPCCDGEERHSVGCHLFPSGNVVKTATFGVRAPEAERERLRNLQETWKLYLAAEAERERLEGELRFYREREAHFARVLSVADGGTYRADWEGAIRRVLDERDRLRAALEEVRTIYNNPLLGPVDAAYAMGHTARRALAPREPREEVDRG